MGLLPIFLRISSSHMTFETASPSTSDLIMQILARVLRKTGIESLRKYKTPVRRKSTSLLIRREALKVKILLRQAQMAFKFRRIQTCHSLTSEDLIFILVQADKVEVNAIIYVRGLFIHY